MNTPVREGETIEGSRTTRNRPYPLASGSLWGVVGNYYTLYGSLPRRGRASSPLKAVTPSGDEVKRDWIAEAVGPHTARGISSAVPSRLAVAPKAVHGIRVVLLSRSSTSASRGAIGGPIVRILALRIDERESARTQQNIHTCLLAEQKNVMTERGGGARDGRWVKLTCTCARSEDRLVSPPRARQSFGPLPRACRAWSSP